MALHLADFFIIQAAITIAVHLLKHRDDAAVKLGYVDHAVGVKIEHLKLFFLATGEVFNANHTIIVDVELFCHELAALMCRIVHIGIGKSGDDAALYQKTGNDQNGK